MFYQLNLSIPNPDTVNYDNLIKDINFESITKGRESGNLYYPINKLNYIPLVRTTTIYSIPIQKFNLTHLKLINQIKTQSKSELGLELGSLNNGLVEIYTNEYKTMGFHSDQALDIEPNSHICIFSHYSNPSTSSIRYLEIQNKITGEYKSIPLTHNSVIIFDTETNKSNLHKIILKNYPKPCSNSKTNFFSNNDKWFGLTLRTSKTLIEFINNKPYSTNNYSNIPVELTLATEEEKKEFYKLRSEENKSINYTYPQINYTISPSDLINPELLNKIKLEN